jgi:lipoic acid synthetase
MSKQETDTLTITDWGRLEYGLALRRQEDLVEERIAGRCSDHLIYVEHPPVVTIGRSGGVSDLRVSEEVLRRRGVAVHTVERGGCATFHGPGQLVVYPIISLTTKDVHLHLNRLLDTAVQVIRSFGLDTELKPGQPGVWVGGAKIASVGIAVKRWVAYHGIALNINADVAWFDLIVPCGRPEERITSLRRELGTTISLSEAKRRFTASFRQVFGYMDSAGPRERPKWLKGPPLNPRAVGRMERRLRHLRLATVCQSAHCPNLGECFGRGTATFMILGTRCTRSCRFCAVERGAPLAVDSLEPGRVARAVQMLGLKHVVVTSVTRDDLPDGGASQFAETVACIRNDCADSCVEVLVPDFMGDKRALQTVCDARPDVFNHNIETVPRLYDRIRPQADYCRSLSVLSLAASRGMWVKSGLMLGFGETGEEVRRVLEDLKNVGCRSVTIGQYLPPSRDHARVQRYVPPEEFEQWAVAARSIGFESVFSGPLVRSSYRADLAYAPDCSGLH